ncbi:MAG: hypothetical protein EOO39_07070 [Cytophagaceae bacterium]|nr:MAG: hypothetical protein EOO39_07070 [Cytophagaceae bacterium]
MNKIWNTEEVTIENLVTHLAEAGLLTIATDEDKLWFRTENGIAYSITIIDDKKFVRLSTYLPLDRDRPKEDKLTFAHYLNAHVFMPTFCLDNEDDLNVSYLLPYQFGMIAAQFSAMVIRFASLLEFLVREQNNDGLIAFSVHGRTTVADNIEDVTEPTVGTEPMVLH